jgi:hypothetical protein
MSSIPAFTGTVSHGTMRPQDVLPAALEALSIIDGDEYRRFMEAWPPAVVASLLARHGDGTSTYSDEDAVEFLWEDVFDAVNAALPEGWYFGGIEGDPADYGVWRVS